MKTTISTEVELIQFEVPEKVFIKETTNLRQKGFACPASIQLADLKEDDIAMLCSAFVSAVYIKADKAVPSYLSLEPANAKSYKSST